jgi:hypothetical protein
METISIGLESNSPRTMMIMGALISGGDFMSLAKQMAEQDKSYTSKKEKIKK